MNDNAVIARCYNQFTSALTGGAERHASALPLFKLGVFYQFARSHLQRFRVLTSDTVHTPAVP